MLPFPKPLKTAALSLVLLLGASLLLTGCGGSSAGASAGGNSLADAASSTAQTDDSTNTNTENTEVHPMIEITVKDLGTMKLELDAEAAPITVQNFIDLANDGFYDGLTFHRIVKGFMVQGGCPEGTGTGGPGHEIKGEFAQNGWDKNNITHTKGVISMARAQNPDSAGSQFFIVDGDATFLDGQYAAFGKLVEGENVLNAIAAVETEYDRYGQEKSVPLAPVVIESIKVVE